MIVGIDLGTTHSLIGYFGDDGPVLIPNSFGKLLTPSIVSLSDDGTVLVGEAAQDRLVTHPSLSADTFKRYMGTNRDITLGQKHFRPEDLSALVLKSLIADAEAHLGTKVTEAVISVPAYFSAAQRKATKVAGEMAGVKVDRLINEPTAAALAYGLEDSRDGASFLVFDLGGGTFDVTILEHFEGIMEVHSSAGDNFLGGEDFLDALINACLKENNLRAQQFSAQEMATLRRRLEVLKRNLSGAAVQTVQFAVGATQYEWQIDEARFTEICEPLVQRLRAPLERAMRDARLRPADLDECVFVGGASRMPLCARLVSRMFGRLPLRHVNPDEAVALGACVAAGMKARNALLEERVLTDVSAHSLGVEISRKLPGGGQETGIFSPIIERNSTVPISRVESYWPQFEGQRAVDLRIFQGESPYTRNNILLGKLDIKLPKRKLEDNMFEVRFTYDVNGILQVDVTFPSSGEKHNLVLQQNPGILSEEEVAASMLKLEALKVHPRDDQANIAVLNRAERVFSEYLDARQYVQQCIAIFTDVLQKQIPSDIAKSREELVAVLDEIEGKST